MMNHKLSQSLFTTLLFCMRGCLIACTILLIATSTRTTSAQSPTANLSDGLLVHWSFDDGQATDSSGNGNNGVSVRVPPSVVPGEYGNALHFGGVDSISRIALEPSSSFGISDKLTISIWFKLLSNRGMNDYGQIVEGTGATHAIFAKCIDSQGPALLATLDGTGEWNLRLFNGRHEYEQPATITQPTHIHLNEWHMATFTHDPISGAKLYLDGVLLSEMNAADFNMNLSHIDKTLYVGSYVHNSNCQYSPGVFEWFPANADFDEVYVYQRALSSAEVQSLYANNSIVSTVTPTPVTPTDTPTDTPTLTPTPTPTNTPVPLDTDEDCDPAKGGQILLNGFGWMGVNVCKNIYTATPFPDSEYGTGTKFQCVELIQRFYQYIFGYEKTWQGVLLAKNVYADPNHKGQMPDITPFTNTIAITLPVWGDVIVFDGTSGINQNVGHVAVVTKVENGRVYFVQQNFGSTASADLPYITQNGKIKIDSANTAYGTVLGWLHSARNYKRLEGFVYKGDTNTTVVSATVTYSNGQIKKTTQTNGTGWFYFDYYAGIPSGPGKLSAQLGNLAGTVDVNLPIARARNDIHIYDLRTPTLTPTRTPTATRTPKPTPTPTPQPAKITLIKDAQPDSKVAFQFKGTGSLGSFTLTDNGAIGNTKNSHTFSVKPGSCSVKETVPAGWFLTTINCNPTANGAIDLTNHSVGITVASKDSVTCTFTDQQAVTIRATLFKDTNSDGIRQSGEPLNVGWTVNLSNAQNIQVATAVTNKQGKVSFTNQLPGAYTICEVLQGGLTNAQPCRSVQVAPGQIADITFANRVAAIAGAVTANDSSVTVLAGPADVPEEANYAIAPTDDVWLNTEPMDQTNMLYLPLINQP